MSDTPNFHMTPKEFRRHGYAMIDWIADYYERIESYPVLSQATPGDIRASLPENPPEEGEPFEAIMADVDRLIMPGITHWQSPDFFGFFPANASGPSVLGDLLSSGLGVQGMLWATSPACTELETHMCDWIVDLLGLPTHFKSTSDGGGVIQDSASNATLCAVLSAREQATNYGVNRDGGNGKLVAYTSSQAHSSIEKAIKIAGFGTRQLRVIPVDDHFAMRPDVLEKQIREDLAAGLTPCFVCATVGTTSSLAIDPVPEIGRLCRQYQLWLHIDAAHAGTASLCPELRGIHDGIDLADSYCFDPHKWMFTNFDCDCFFVRDRSILINTLSILPEYLKNEATTSGAVIDYRDWQVPLGRRFRALKLWFVIRHFGTEGLRKYVRYHVALTRKFSDWVGSDGRFEFVAPPMLNLVCFRHIDGDKRTQEIMDRLNADGHMYLTHTKLNGRFTLRFCIGQVRTEEKHVVQAWERIQETTSKLEN
jgi:aromatic-L-amino-acid decarboxylase